MTSTTSTSTLLPHFRLRRRRTDHPSDICHDIRVRLRSGPRLPSHVLDCFLLLPWSHLLPCAFIFLSTIAFLPRALIAAALGLPSRPEASAAPARNSAWGAAGRVLNVWAAPAADAADLFTTASSLAAASLTAVTLAAFALHTAYTATSAAALREWLQPAKRRAALTLAAHPLATATLAATDPTTAAPHPSASLGYEMHRE